jgi:hypothetical protein
MSRHHHFRFLLLSTKWTPIQKTLLSISLTLSLYLILLYLLPNCLQSLQEWSYYYWLFQFAPVSDQLRIYLYSSIYLCAKFSFLSRPPYGDSFLQAATLFRFTPLSFVSREGILRFIYHPLWLSNSFLSMLTNICEISFISCILGFGGQYPVIMVFISSFLLQTIALSLVGTSHRWYVPVFCLGALCFSNGNGTYSLDYFLFNSPILKQFNINYPFSPPCLLDNYNHTLPNMSIYCTGFSRQLILYFSLFTLCSAGFTKLMNSGIEWCYGRPLAYYVSSEQNGSFGFAKKMLMKPSIAFISSVMSIAFEILSIAPCFVTNGLENGKDYIPSHRLQYLRFLLGLFTMLSAAGFHFCIWLTMFPNYLPQTFCYFSAVSLWEKSNPFEDPSSIYFPTLMDGTLKWYDLSNFGLFATFFVILTIMIFIFRVEFWPFTAVPMYSFYRDSSYSYDYINNIEQAHHLAREYIISGYPNTLGWSANWVSLRLIRQSNAANNIDLKDFACIKKNGVYGVLAKQWRRTIHNIACLEIIHQTGMRYAVSDKIIDPSLSVADIIQSISKTPISSTSPAKEWLHLILKDLIDCSMKSQWNLPSWVKEEGYLQLQMEMRTGGPLILGKIKWKI